jgi:hypothetical protein
VLYPIDFVSFELNTPHLHSFIGVRVQTANYNYDYCDDGSHGSGERDNDVRRIHEVFKHVQSVENQRQNETSTAHEKNPAQLNTELFYY